MTSNPLYVLKFLVNSFLAFFIWALVVEIFMRVFRIRKPRVRSTLRLLPFFSLLFDVAFREYSITYWLNPLNCSSCVQKSFLETFFPHLQMYLSQNKMSLIHYLGADYHHSAVPLLLTFLVLVSIYFIARQIIQSFSLVSAIKKILSRSTLSTRPIYNIQLSRILNQYRVKIFISNEILIPLASYTKVIIIPQRSLEILTQQEYEAVIAHELEHIKYSDSFVRLFYHFVATLFWWVPTESWMKKMDHEQEMACDQNVLSYGLHEDSIASALLKVSRQIKDYKQVSNNQLICCLVDKTNPTKARIKAILGLYVPENIKFSRFNVLWATMCLLFLLTCLF